MEYQLTGCQNGSIHTGQIEIINKSIDVTKEVKRTGSGVKTVARDRVTSDSSKTSSSEIGMLRWWGGGGKGSDSVKGKGGMSTTTSLPWGVRRVSIKMVRERLGR